jgi:hypothetical protein
MERITVDWLFQATIILGMFILRLGVPLAITLAVGYWLRRLDAKWQAEALARQATSLARQKLEAEPKIEVFRVIGQPCWVLKDCPQVLYAQCPAFQQAEIPCWLSRYRAEGSLPAKCYHCELFSPRQRVASSVVKN